MGVELPRKVIINNWKLEALYYALTLLVVVFVGHSMYTSRAWRSTTIPMGSYTYWVEAYNEYEAAKASDLASPMCKTFEAGEPSPFTHWYYARKDDTTPVISHDVYEYDNFMCRELDSVERYLKTPSAAYVRTMIEEIFVGAVTTPVTTTCTDACAATYKNVSVCEKMHPSLKGLPTGTAEKKNNFGDCICECKSSTDFFPVGVPGLVLAISHQAKVDYAALGIEEEVTSSDKMYTGLMMNVEEKTEDNDFGVKQWFLPGKTIRLPIKDLLEIAGVDLDKTVDTEEEAAVKDKNFATVGAKYPSARVTGAQFKIEISYHNKNDRSNFHPDKGCEESSEDEDPSCGFVAYVTVSGEQKWNSQQRMDYGSTPPGPDGAGLSRSRYMYNLSFEFFTKGSYSYQDSSMLVAALGILVIYIGMPSKLVGALAEYGLGNLSVLYKAGIRQQISAESVFAGITARGLMYSAVFDHLLLPKDAEGGNVAGFGEGESVEPTVESKQLEHLILQMLKSGGRIDSPAEAAKVRSLLAIEMGGNTRRKFIDVALNSDLATLRSVADNFNSDRKPALCGDLEGKKKGCCEMMFSNPVKAKKGIDVPQGFELTSRVTMNLDKK